VSEIRVYDWRGNLRDLAYLRSRYGNFIIQEAPAGSGPVYKISALRERAESDFDPAHLATLRGTSAEAAWREAVAVRADAALVVRVLDSAGRPLQGQGVAYYWPDAPVDAGAGPAGGVIPGMVPGRALLGITSDTGSVGLGMGRGAYFWPGSGEIGPHAIWMHGAATRSDIILGAGMVAMTNHYHYDVEFMRLDGDPGDEEGTVRFYDEHGMEQGAAWAQDLFGVQVVHDPWTLPVFELVALVAASGFDKTLTVTVLDENEFPMQGQLVGFIPRDVGGNGQRGETDSSGRVDFGMDDAHRFYVPSEQGHWCVGLVDKPSQIYESAGWVFLGKKDPGRWFNPVFKLVLEPDVPDPDPPDPPDPDPPEPPAADEFQVAVLRNLEDIKALLAEILDASL
jgi:hypothetical protein